MLSHTCSAPCPRKRLALIAPRGTQLWTKSLRSCRNHPRARLRSTKSSHRSATIRESGKGSLARNARSLVRRAREDRRPNAPGANGATNSGNPRPREDVPIKHNADAPYLTRQSRPLNESPDTILKYFRPQKTLGTKQYILKRLLELIEDGTIKVGDQIPSATKIARRVGKHAAVVFSAIAELRDWGLFESRGNLGTFLVRKRKLKVKLKRPDRPLRLGYSYDDWGGYRGF